MTRISAAENIVIITQPNRWQLLINTDFVDNVQGDGVLMEAALGQPLHYTTAFARSRRLPKSGQLSTQYVKRVVLGWSEDDEAWHLGLLFDQSLADARGSRWCQLAKWPDPEQDIFRDLAVDAGRNLAQQIACPFNIVPLSRTTSSATLPKRPQMPLPDPPVDLQGWQLQRQSNGWFTLVRDRQWARERVRRVFWYSLWVVVYVILAVATILSDIALPRPEWLPYLGLATALLLVGLVIYSLYELMSKPRRIVIDPQTRQIWGVNSAKEGKHKPIWRMGREQVDSVYVSQVIKQQRDKAIIQYGEINLRLTSGNYYYLISQDEAETITEATRLNGTEAIVPLESGEVQTGLQIAGAHIGQALEVPVWYDHRGK